jgi:hypothetical protein
MSTSRPRNHVGVYAVGHRGLSLHGRWMAAVLACGPGALLSHQDAAALLRILSWTAHSTINVTIPGRRRRGRPGIALHQVRRLHREDRAVAEQIPVTSVARTLLDLAEVVRPQQLERSLEEAERLRLLDLEAVERLLDRSRGRRGRVVLAMMLRDYRGSPPSTRSELEGRFLALCRQAGLPPPAVNVRVAGLEVDAVWHDHRLVAELDGHEFHRTRAAFERDRIRDARLQLAGYSVVRFTYRRLESAPAEVVQTVRSLLSPMA